MYRIRMILTLGLSGTLLLTGCQYITPQKPTLKVIPIEKTIPKTIEQIEQKEPLPKEKPSEETADPAEKKPTIGEKKEAPEKPIEIAVIVSYFRFLNSLPEKALKQEHTRTQKEFSEDGSPINRLRLAMLLGFTNTKHRNTQASLDLLSRYLEDPKTLDPMLRDFSYLLVSFVQQLKKQDDAYKQLAQQLKKGRTENSKLKKMIEALKTIEKNLVEREKTEKK